MSKYDNQIFNSDLDAFKNSGNILDAQLIFSGSVAGGGQMQKETTIEVENPDFAQLIFDNSAKHSGKFKNVIMERMTMAHENTNGSELGINFYLKVSGNTVTIGGLLFNPYATSVTLQTTTVNFRYIPYEATL